MQKIPLWTETDLYALMEPDVRRVAGLSGPIDFPRLRTQGRGETLEDVYADLSAAAGADLMPLVDVERSCRARYAALLGVMGPAKGHPYEALRFLGYRAMQAVAATKPEWQGAAGKFGMYLLSNAMWLADEMRRGGFDRLVFLARDGRLVKEAFDAVNAVLHIPVETDYVRVSRQAVFPLHFRSTADLMRLPVLVDMSAHTPRTLMRLFEPVADRARSESVLQKAGFDLEARFDEASALRFAAVFREGLFEQQRFDAYRAHAREYLAPHFTGKCATFDVGYNLRSESVMAEVTSADITAFITHTDSDLPDRRGVPYRTLYPVSPYVSWVAREQFLLTKGDPSCLRYGGDGPVLGNCPGVSAGMKTIQRQAMAYVREVVRIFGEDLARLPFRPVDGCLPFEDFLRSASPREMASLRGNQVENAFHDGVTDEDSTFLQWRLMQTDAANRTPPVLVKLRRAAIRLREDPRGLLSKLKR